VVNIDNGFGAGVCAALINDPGAAGRGKTRRARAG
jgi:NCAIR mutase (PurE)-related protein